MPQQHQFTTHDYGEHATNVLRNELREEILHHEQVFVRRDGNLNQSAVFSWLQRVERDAHTVKHAAKVTDGSIWGLASLLTKTLQPTIESAQQRRDLESAVNNMTHVHLFRNLMSFWQMRDANADEDALADGLTARQSLKETDGDGHWM